VIIERRPRIVKGADDDSRGLVVTICLSCATVTRTWQFSR